MECHENLSEYLIISYFFHRGWFCVLYT